MKGLILYVLAGVAIATVAIAQQPPAPEAFPESLQQTSEDVPRRLTIAVSVAETSDLKVQQGDRVVRGQLLADRSRQRQRLEAQKAQLALTLERLKTASITPPLPPLQQPAIATPTYLEEQAAIDRAKAEVEQAEAVIDAKKQELVYLAELPNLDPLVLEHEQAKLAELQREHTATVRDYQLAHGKRSTTEYRHTVTLAEQVASQNRAALEYQRQWAAYEQRLRDRDYQVAQAQLRLDEVENAIATLAVVRSPYAGRIRRIQWLGQSADGSLSAEITLLIRSSDGSGTPLPGQQPGVSGGVDGAGDSEFLGD